MVLKFSTLFLLFFLTTKSFGQNYIKYQKIFNRIDEDVLFNNLNLATMRLDTIYNSYQFIYASHSIKALQICTSNKDSINANTWLIKCFKQGIPLWILRTNGLTQKAMNYSTTQLSIQKYDSFNAIYKSSINLKLGRQVDSLLTIDQKYTRNVNDGFILFRHTLFGLQWLINNKKEFKEIIKIIDHYGFPGERLIGLPLSYNDSALAAKNIVFYGPHVFDSRAYLMLIHYYSNPNKDINDRLYSNMIKGYIPPYQFGAINDFMARWGKKKYGKYQYYNVWHSDRNIKNLDDINIRRDSIGLNAFEIQERNSELAKLRRINKKANEEIILE